MRIPAILLLLVAISTNEFECPLDEYRICVRDPLYCGPESHRYFLSVHYPQSGQVLIKCLKFVDWTKFNCEPFTWDNSSSNLKFEECKFPEDYQLKSAVERVGAHGLESLTFSRGNLSKIINVKAFEGLSTVRNLHLHNTGLTNVSANLFAGIPHLVLLDLTNNKVKQLPKDLFVNLRKIETLELGGNKIQVIGSETFHPLENLTRLSLRDNHLTTIESGGLLTSSNRCNT